MLLNWCISLRTHGSLKQSCSYTQFCYKFVIFCLVEKAVVGIILEQQFLLNLKCLKPFQATLKTFLPSKKPRKNFQYLRQKARVGESKKDSEMCIVCTSLAKQKYLKSLCNLFQTILRGMGTLSYFLHSVSFSGSVLGVSVL